MIATFVRSSPLFGALQMKHIPLSVLVLLGASDLTYANEYSCTMYHDKFPSGDFKNIQLHISHKTAKILVRGKGQNGKI
jgi:hypothetical protein